ncbi:MAG: glycosyltransferase [Pirellulales bacterium]
MADALDEARNRLARSSASAGRAAGMTGPIRILELRCADGGGGGPEKTILLGAARSCQERFAVTVCYLREAKDGAFDIGKRAKQLGVDFVEIAQRHALDPAIWRQARNLVRERRIDIVHAHDYKTNLLALFLARSDGIIPLSTAHGYTGRSFRERFVYYPMDRRLLARFPLVIAVSSQLRETLIRAGARPERVRTVLNGIDHRRFVRNEARAAEYRAVLGLAPGEVAIGSVGRVEPQKRFDILLQAFVNLSARQPNLRLFIAGEGSLRGKLEAMARELGVAERCRFLGHRTDADGIYQALDVFVQSSDYEGTPNVVLEAMAFETPIVATDVGGTAELIQDGVHGLVVPPGNPEALARAIDRAITDPSGTQSRVASARARVEQELSFEFRMKKVEAIYEELLSTRRRLAEPSDTSAVDACCPESCN